MARCIAEQVKALLSKTTKNGCTEAEADAFLAKARELIAKHNLDAAALLAGGGPAPAYGSLPACQGEPPELPYIGPILMACFEVHVVAIRDAGVVEGVVIFGDEHNARLAVGAFGVLRSTFAGLFDRAVASRKVRPQDRASFYQGLRAGFLDRIAFDAKLARLAKPGVGTAIAPLKSKLDEAVGEAFPGMSIVRHDPARGEAFEAGYRQSKEVTLENRVGARTAPALGRG